MGKQEKKKPSGNFLLETVKKNLPWAVLPLASAILFLVFFQHDTGPESSMLQRSIFIVIVLGGFLAALGALVLGPWGLAGGYGMILVMTLPRVLPEPWNRYFSLVYLVLLFGGIPLYHAVKGKTQVKRDTPPPDFEVPEDPVLSGCVLVLHNLSGRVYQLIRWGGVLRAYRVGGELKGIYDGKLVEPADPRPLEKGDLEFPISQIQLKIVPHGVYGITAKLRTEKKRWNCNPYITTTPEELEDFLRAVIPQARTPKEAPEQPVDTARSELLKKIRTGLLIAIGAVNLPWLFLKVPYKIFSGAAMTLALAVFGLICIFPDSVSLDDTKHPRTGKNDMITPMIFSNLPLVLRSLTDFNFLDFARLALLALIPAAIVLAALLIRAEEVRRRFGAAFLCLFFAYAFGLGSIGQLNFLLNAQEPTAHPAVITSMEIDASGKGPVEYELTVRTAEFDQLELNTSQENYQSLKVGDNITVYIVPGGLGIPYAVAE